MADPPILVTGATGTVGSQLVRQLVGSGHRLRAFVRDPEKLRNSGSLVEIVLGDLERPATLSKVFRGIKKAFVLAPPVANLEELEANAFAAAEQAGVEHIVYLSNFGAGEFDDDMWQAHGANERRLRASGMNWTILRPVRFMSNTPYGWAAVHSKGQLLEPLGGRKVTMIDPRDIAAVALKALIEPGHAGKVYELVGEALTGEEMARCLSEALGKPIHFIEAGEEEVRQDLIRSGLPPAIAEKVLYYFARLREGRWYETSTLGELLQRPPRTYSDWLSENVSPE